MSGEQTAFVIFFFIYFFFFNTVSSKNKSDAIPLCNSSDRSKSILQNYAPGTVTTYLRHKWHSIYL